MTALATLTASLWSLLPQALAVNLVSRQTRIYWLNLPPGTFLQADFDGDRRADRAELVLHGGQFEARVHLSLGGCKQLPYFQPLSLNQYHSIAAGTLHARDIDLDRDLDLIWAVGVEDQSVIIWLGDGEGNFEQVTDNAPYATALGELLRARTPPGVAQHAAAEIEACLLQVRVYTDSPPDALSGDSYDTPFSALDASPSCRRSGWLTDLRKRAPPSLPL